MSQNSAVQRGGAGFGLALLALTALLACPSERYTRPAGPAPRYESAPLAPWTNGTTPVPGASGDDALESEIDRALAGDAGPAPESATDEASKGQ
jgi:hypothetical protein